MESREDILRIVFSLVVFSLLLSIHYFATYRKLDIIFYNVYNYYRIRLRVSNALRIKVK